MWGCVNSNEADFDGDGSPDALDCAPSDPSTHPGALDPFGDLIDQDCDGNDGIDLDGDGYPSNPELLGTPSYDCDDGQFDVHPEASDVVGDQFSVLDCDANDNDASVQ